MSVTIAEESHASNGVPRAHGDDIEVLCDRGELAPKGVQLRAGASQLSVDRCRVLDLRREEFAGDLLSARGVTQRALHSLAQTHRSQPVAVEDHELLFDAEPSHAQPPLADAIVFISVCGKQHRAVGGLDLRKGTGYPRP